MPDPTGAVSHTDFFHRGMSWKVAVRAATTASITISTGLNNGDTIDGITLVTGDRVLVKDQATGSQNGIYIVGASPTRAWDMDQDATTSVPASEVMGAFVYVIAGTVNGGKVYRATNTTAPTIGSTTITFSEFTSGGSSDAILRYNGAAEWFLDHGNVGATETIDLANGNAHWITLDSATCTLTFSGAVATISGQAVASSFTLAVEQDGTGGRLITWPGSVVWPDTAPTLSTTAADVDVLTFWTPDGGTTWYGFSGGGSGSALTIKDEGATLDTAVTSIDFVGTGVVATNVSHAVTVTIGTSEVVMTSGIAPPDPVLNSDGDDWVYSS